MINAETCNLVLVIPASLFCLSWESSLCRGRTTEDLLIGSWANCFEKSHLGTAAECPSMTLYLTPASYSNTHLSSLSTSCANLCKSSWHAWLCFKSSGSQGQAPKARPWLVYERCRWGAALRHRRSTRRSSVGLGGRLLRRGFSGTAGKPVCLQAFVGFKGTQACEREPDSRRKTRTTLK